MSAENDYSKLITPNSNAYKNKQAADQEEKKMEKVVTGVVKTKKKSKIKDALIAENAQNIGSYVVMDVLIPAVKKALKDIVTDGIEMLLYGSTGGRKKTTNSSYVSYDRFSGDSRASDRDRDRARLSYSYNDIILETRGEAEEVLMGMDAALERYGMVRVADLYDLVGISGNFTDNKYGWTNLSRAKVMRVRDGYSLDLPRAMPI